MKRIAIASISVLLLTIFGCKDKTFITREANTPIYQDLDEWRKNIFSIESPRKLERPGKIYLYNDHLFVMEPMVGIHFINNSSPHNPEVFGFLPIYACSDISIKDDFLYVDSYFDILVFDITDPTVPKLAHRIDNAINFDDYTSLPGLNEGYPIGAVKETDKVVIGWEITEVTDEQFLSSQNFVRPGFDVMLSTFETTGGSSVGLGGSMARFTINDDYLYTLKANILTSFAISTDGNLSSSGNISINRDAETIFPYNNHLFMGTTTGMIIYSLSIPEAPQYISCIDHIQACDPVVVDGDRAYVTMSSGITCWGANQLDVINVSNYAAPSIISSYWMSNPKGLGVDGSLLFLCDGIDGLKVYDKTNDAAITGNMLSHFEEIHAFDVIPYNGTLVMTGNDGIYQYDYSDLNDISQISMIPISNP